MTGTYRASIRDDIYIRNTQPDDAEHLGRLQTLIFPTLSPSELIQAPHYRHHLTLFPEGQFAVLDGNKYIGMSTTIRHHFTTEDHRFLDISAELWMDTHEPDGDWLYGMDVGVHPDYRGIGIARAIYRARQFVCRALGLKGQLIAGMTNGYYRFADKISVKAYYEGILRGEWTDPTVSAQQRLGFKPIRLIENYLDDPACGNAAVLMSLSADVEV